MGDYKIGRKCKMHGILNVNIVKNDWNAKWRLSCVKCDKGVGLETVIFLSLAFSCQRRWISTCWKCQGAQTRREFKMSSQWTFKEALQKSCMQCVYRFENMLPARYLVHHQLKIQLESWGRHIGHCTTGKIWDFPRKDFGDPPPSKFDKTIFLLYWSFIANLWGECR